MLQLPNMPKKKTKAQSKIDPEMAIVGMRFQQARERLGLTQTELAKLVKGDQTRLSRFERGERGLSAPVLIRLLQAFAARGVDVHQCLVGTGKSAPELVLGGEQPELLRELQEVLSRHIGNGGNGRDTPDKVERTSKRRHKR